MAIPKKSRIKGELIPSVIIEFHDWMNLWLTKSEYEVQGGYRGLLKDYCIPVGKIKKVHHFLLNPKDFPTNDWEP